MQNEAIPYPHIKKGGRPAKYPWRTVEVGEYFFVQGRSSTSIQTDVRRRYKPLKFRCKKIIINGVAWVKVTRVSSPPLRRISSLPQNLTPPLWRGFFIAICCKIAVFRN